MKQFIPTHDNSFSFSSCEFCEARCCDGKEGTLFSQIILKDFSKVYKRFPIVFIFGELGYLKPVLLLTNGKTYCKYLKDNKCTIYNQRPNICKAYPLSANIDNNIYIDIFCPAVNDKNPSDIIVEDNKIKKEFDNELFNNYQDKYIDTFHEFENFNKKENFTLAITLNGINFYKYIKETQNNYMKMHQDSLIHLQNDYFTNSN